LRADERFGTDACRRGGGWLTTVDTHSEHYNNFARSTTGEMTDLMIVLTTMPDDARSDELAATLVRERLAACVNVPPPMVSTYRWKGTIARDPERQIVIKTSRGRLAELETRLRALHPYELPEFLVLAVDAASDAYANWVGVEVGPAPE